MNRPLPAGPLGEALRRLAETIEPATSAPAVTTLRAAPANDNQPDFFVPSLCDIALKDGIGLMDIACFRLGSKSMTQRIRHELPGVTVEVLGGRDGLATIHDYDIVLLMISQLTQAMREWRAGRGPRPPMRLKLHAADILAFCRRGRGGRDYHLIDGALRRLHGTFICIEASGPRTPTRRTGYFSLLSDAEILSRADNGRIEEVTLGIPSWLYSGVVDSRTPEVLTLHRDYLLIKSGMARFVYRLARKAARLEDVAAKAGVSVLTVKRRVALASLTDEVKARVREGEISLAAAEALTLGNAEQQRAAIARLDSGYRYDADDIRDWLTGEKPALSLAIFPLERYEGTTTSDLFADEDATVFDDAEQFHRLQAEAVEALAAQHRAAGAAFVDILTENYAAWWQYREADAEAGETGGVVIHFKPSGRVEVREGLARREVRASVAEETADHPAAPKEKPEYTGAVIRMVAAHKSLAVMAGLLANPRKAREVAVVTMLNACDWTARARLDVHPALGHFAGEDSQPETYAKVEGAAQAVMEALDIAATLTSRYPAPDRGAWETLLRPQKEPLALYEAVTALDDAALDALHLLLTTLTFGQGNMDALDDGSSLFNRVASDLGVSMRDHWCPDEAFLTRRRKDQLEAIAKETGAVTRLGALKDYNKTQLAAALARHFERCAADDKLIAADLKARANTWLPEAMRFGGVAVEDGDMAEAEEASDIEADIEADDAIGDGFPTPAVAEDAQPAHAA